MIRISDTKLIHPSSLGPVEHRWQPKYHIEESGWRRFERYQWTIWFTVGGAKEPLYFHDAEAVDIYHQITGQSPPPMPTEPARDLEPVRVILA